MRVIFDVTDPDERKHTMTEKKGKAEGSDVKALLAGMMPSFALWFGRRCRRCWKRR